LALHCYCPPLQEITREIPNSDEDNLNDGLNPLLPQPHRNQVQGSSSRIAKVIPMFEWPKVQLKLDSLRFSMENNRSSNYYFGLENRFGVIIEFFVVRENTRKLGRVNVEI
jgi:hypothetical protein